jgi:peptide chain release factor 2
MGEPSFWDNPSLAKTTLAKLSSLKAVLNKIHAYQKAADDNLSLLEFIKTIDDSEGEAWLQELESGVKDLNSKLDQLEIESYLCGPLDKNNAIFSIHAGAGGTESCDWVEMLLRMYTRWAERRGYSVEIDDIQAGEEAGMSRVTIRILGLYAYGYAKAERGVHRLVRISPFDSNQRRHTSFASVDVIAEIEEDIDIQIKDEELRIDTYRSSGKGGQHVNKTDSAIRITHMPSGIVVTCQTERSQIKNKATAMKLLRSRLYEKREDEKRSQMERFYGEKGEMGWGNQIRSYVLQPYQIVKDLRTNIETGNVQAVLDGDLDSFIGAWLKAGCPQKRSSG